MERHIVAFPFPAQGHINPMLHFCKRIASKGIKVTLITFIDEEMITNAHESSVEIEPISINSDDKNPISTVEDYWKSLHSKISQRLSEIIEKNCQISCLVYDAIMPWALEMAKQFGLIAASFFTQSCAVSAIYCRVHKGNLNIPPAEEGYVSLEGMPLLGSCDLPTSLYDQLKCPYHLRVLTNQFSNVKQADWIFFNSFNTLEEEVMRWLETQYSVKLVGPTIPLMCTNKIVEHNTNHGINLFKPNNKSCMEWLDSKETCSVVYVSFGSLAELGEKQMEEVASGLKMSNCNFLWVVREFEIEKLPSTFVEDTSNKGIVVSWCSQLQVLSHESVGCFMTHCGWNSTLEALSMGIPMVAMPQWSDQTTNAKFVTDVWKIGVRVKVDAQGIVSKEEIDLSIREVMNGDSAIEIRKNSEKWKNFAKEAIEEGGSSCKNIDEFVAKLKCNF